MNYILLPVFFLFFVLTMKSQGDSLEYVNSLKISGEEIAVDNFGYLYTRSNSALNKYNSNLELMASYSNKSYGNPDVYDVTNPLKILVFYKNRNNVVFLDKTLSEQVSVVNLERKNLLDVLAIGSSNQDGFWVFDNDKQELILFDFNMKEKFKSGSINQLLGYRISPFVIKEKNKSVYLLDSNIGLLIFDLFAGYHKTIPLKKAKQFWVFKNYFVFLVENKLKFIQENMLSEFDLAVPVGKIKSACLKSNLVYVATNDEIVIFKLNF